MLFSIFFVLSYGFYYVLYFGLIFVESLCVFVVRGILRGGCNDARLCMFVGVVWKGNVFYVSCLFVLVLVVGQFIRLALI